MFAEQLSYAPLSKRVHKGNVGLGNLWEIRAEAITSVVTELFAA